MARDKFYYRVPTSRVCGFWEEQREEGSLEVRILCNSLGVMDWKEMTAFSEIESQN